MRIIIVTGTPGTGKTTIAKLICTKLNFKYIDVNEIIKNNDICDEYDSERKCTIVDGKKLKGILEAIIKQSKTDIVIDSHMSQVVSSRCINLCIVTRCSLRTLKNRLEARGYNEQKVRENLDAEIFENCLTEAQENKHKVHVIDTTRLNQVHFIEEVKKWI